VKDNRDLCLSISRIKAPKRRMGSQNNKMGLAKKTTIKGPQIQSIVPSQLIGTGTAGMNVGMASHSHQSQPLPFADSLGSASPDQSTSTTCSGSIANDCLGSEAETYQWLLNAGVPVSAFDPVQLSDRQSSTKIITSELVDCVDEITSLFASTSPAASPCHATTEAPATVKTEAPMPLLHSFHRTTTPSVSNAEDIPLTVSLSIHSCDDQVPLPDLLDDGSFPNIGNDNWALW
jgi:hypothetical protein